jgi:hypothetical protein
LAVVEEEEDEGNAEMTEGAVISVLVRVSIVN